ncbi:signal peptidase I [Phaeacidiphilus oryzae]|uniref:signal peptidase I n=1 Tax=Phaeacidiphilus oryzae TaxID=348818 RepID=UPI000A03AE18|nr:signal peptidase I [Phaeacidiphilus oryzae]
MTQDQRIGPSGYAGAPAGSSARGARSARPARRGRAGGVIQGVLIAVGLIAMLGGFAMIAVQYRPYNVPTDSMESTIPAGTTVLAHTVKGTQVGRGDIVVFKDPQWGSMAEVKRVAGVGGDTVACCDAHGRVTVNGKPIDEPYLNTLGLKGMLGANGQAASTFTAKVPAGRLFLLGDNRAVSLDSRSHLQLLSGTVPESAVMGRVEGAVWPFAQIGTIGRTSAFDALPGRDATAHGPLGPLAVACVGGGVLVLATAAIGSLAGALGRRRRAGG